MTNKGIVTEVNGDMLTIVFERHEACGDCHACMRGSNDCGKHTVKLRGKARQGDIVEVEMDDSHVMAASAMAYLIPLAGFLVGLVVGWGISRGMPSVNAEMLTALCAVLGTGAAYLVMRALDPHFSKGRWEQRIISVTHPQDRTE
ncbi:MAG TPA: SoxR reducing system RseC family protein [Candidatus Ventricola intestinavium]|nr:SoxR reducing system RseC family protein [Candidatus Ventricola intestinavium]